MFSFSGQPGLKGEKGVMGRYGKVGPSGMKGNLKIALEIQLLKNELSVVYFMFCK